MEGDPVESEALSEIANVPIPTAKRIRERRLRRGWSLAELEARAGVPPGRAWKVERMVAVLPWELEAILAALGVPAEAGSRRSEVAVMFSVCWAWQWDEESRSVLSGHDLHNGLTLTQARAVALAAELDAHRLRKPGQAVIFDAFGERVTLESARECLVQALPNRN